MNIVVLAGGLSSERDVSFKSGSKVLAALKRCGHKAFMIDVFMGYGDQNTDINALFENPDAVECKYATLSDNAPDLHQIREMREDKSDCFFGPNVIDICRKADIVFIALHGSDGENGKVQSTFDLYGIKYTGNGYLGCAIAMDKGVTKQFLRGFDIPFPSGFTVRSTDSDARHTSPTFPCVVKPACGGSSVGVTIVKEKEDYDKALDNAFQWEKEVLVEEYISGREFTVGVIDGQALPVIEIVPVDGFYDYHNKYAEGATMEICPANIDDSIAGELQVYAERVCSILGLNVYARMDFIVGDNGNVYCLEANTLPGMTETSLIPLAASKVGLDYDSLCEEIIRISMNKYV